MSVTAASPPRQQTVPRRAWLGVIAVAAATFIMVTVESLPVGLLTPIGRSFHISSGAAALSVTLPGLAASAAAPLLPVVIRRADRRAVLLALVAVVVAATVVSAAAPNLTALLVSRLVGGLGIGGFWALAATVAIRLVPEQHIPRATSLAFGGATVASVLGAPTATMIGAAAGWRAAFAALAALGVAVAVALRILLPLLPAADTVGIGDLRGQLRDPAVRAAVAATFLLVGAHWEAFTFIRPLLTGVSGLGSDAIGPAQLGFGVAGVVGTFAAGSAAGGSPRRTLLVAGVFLGAALALFRLVGTTPAGGIAVLLVWGLAFGAIPVGIQSWILRIAPNAAEAATALNTCVYNLAIAVGAASGGVIADATGTTWVLAAGTALCAIAVLAVGLSPSRDVD